MRFQGRKKVSGAVRKDQKILRGRNDGRIKRGEGGGGGA